MSLDTVITRARAAQERLFLDEATVRRYDGDPVTDPETGAVTNPSTVIYQGRCRILGEQNRSSDNVIAGETLLGRPDFSIRFPVDTDIARDDVVTVTASRWDPGMVGKSYTVRSMQNDGRQYARIASLEEYVVPTEG